MDPFFARANPLATSSRYYWLASSSHTQFLAPAPRVANEQILRKTKLNSREMLRSPRISPKR